tara:strand:+ start:828 stop:1100 length:273 start_codon:yes stop_codon:yes gene_type:complete
MTDQINNQVSAEMKLDEEYDYSCCFCDGQHGRTNNFKWEKCTGEGGEAWYKNKYETICNKCWICISGSQNETVASGPKGRTWMRGEKINF